MLSENVWFQSPSPWKLGWVYVGQANPQHKENYKGKHALEIFQSLLFQACLLKPVGTIYIFSVNRPPFLGR